MTDPLLARSPGSPCCSPTAAWAPACSPRAWRPATAPELWNLEHPGAGARGASRLRRGGLGHRPDQQLRRQPLPAQAAQRRRAGSAELNRAAAWVAREAADAGRPAASWSRARSARRARSYRAARRADAGRGRRAAFAEQAQALAEGGLRSALDRDHVGRRGGRGRGRRVPRATGLPIVATMTFDTNGRTMMGLTTEAAVGLLRAACRAGPSPSAPTAASARPSW